MAKVRKHFTFQMPINKKAELVYTLEVSGIGYEYTNEDPEERFDYDIEDIRIVGGLDNIKDFALHVYEEEINAATHSQVRYIFGFKDEPDYDEYKEDRPELFHQENEAA